MQLAGHERPVKVLVPGWARAGSSLFAAVGRAARCCTRPPRKRLRLHPWQGSPPALGSLGCFSSLPKAETSTRPVVFNIGVAQLCLTPSHGPRHGSAGLTPRRGSRWLSWGSAGAKRSSGQGFSPKLASPCPSAGPWGGHQRRAAAQGRRAQLAI